MNGLTAEHLADYQKRLREAKEELIKMAREAEAEEVIAYDDDARRLRAKAAGVSLALDYLRGYQ